MKNNHRIVIWGTNAQEEKVLIALELLTDNNKVMLYTFPEAIATRDFETKLTDEWRKGQPVEFPEGYTVLERELSVTENLLPEELKVERPDIIQRAQTEWHFAVLSTKLHHAYEQELAEFKEKIENLQDYDVKVFNALRKFWDKVQTQTRERNLFREHADRLRDNINALFDHLKQVRKRVESQFSDVSQKVYEEFAEVLTGIEERIASGNTKLHHVFDDLKQLQARYRNARLTNEHRESIWRRIDNAYKAAKERRYGPGINEGSLADRHTRRLDGLMAAIRRLEDSIRRDDDELKFQRKRIAGAEGQLEAQIREAKIKMVEERINSKREQLADMNKVRAEVEHQIQDAKNRDAKRAEKEANRRKVEEAKQKAKSEIDAEMKAKHEAMAPALEKAKAVEAAEAAEAKSNITAGEGEQAAGEDKPGFFENLGTAISEAFEDAVDTVKAVASVAADKAGDAYDKAAEKAAPILEAAADKAEEIIETAKEKAAPVLEAAAEKAGDILETAKEKVGDLYDKASEKMAPMLESAAEKANELVDTVKERGGDMVAKMQGKRGAEEKAETESPAEEEPVAETETPAEEGPVAETETPASATETPEEKAPAKSGKKSKPAKKAATDDTEPTKE